MLGFYHIFRNLAMAGLVSFFCFTQLANAGGHADFNAFGFALVVPEANIEEVEAVLASHRNFMSETHSVDGDIDTRLNSYSVIKAPQMNDPTDPSKGMTGNVIYILSEHYETPQGLAMHMEAGNSWDGIGAMMGVIMKYGVAMGAGVKISAMNR